MVDLSNFGENLTAFMVERSINAPALAKCLKIDRSNVTRYMRGDRLPSFTVFLAMIEYFSVSADVLLGLKEFCTETQFLPVMPFGDRLRAVMEETMIRIMFEIPSDLTIQKVRITADCVNGGEPTIIRDANNPRAKLGAK